MNKEMKRFYILVLVLSLGILMIILSMAIPILTSSSDFSILRLRGQQQTGSLRLIPGISKLSGYGWILSN